MSVLMLGLHGGPRVTHTITLYAFIVHDESPELRGKHAPRRRWESMQSEYDRSAAALTHGARVIAWSPTGARDARRREHEIHRADRVSGALEIGAQMLVSP